MQCSTLVYWRSLQCRAVQCKYPAQLDQQTGCQGWLPDTALHCAHWIALCTLHCTVLWTVLHSEYCSVLWKLYLILQTLLSLCRLYFTLHVVIHSLNPTSNMADGRCRGWIIFVFVKTNNQTDSTRIMVQRVVLPVQHYKQYFLITDYRSDPWPGIGAGEERRRVKREAETVTVSSQCYHWWPSVSPGPGVLL